MPNSSSSSSSSAPTQTVAQRNARLDALTAAATAWASSQTTQLQSQVTLLQAILLGRTGSNSLPAAAAAATGDLVISSINDFIQGS
jgi:hypothetical protein